MTIIYIDTRSLLDTTKSAVKDSFLGNTSTKNIENIIDGSLPLSSFFRNSNSEEYFAKKSIADEVIILIKTELSQFVLEFIQDKFLKDISYTIHVYSDYIKTIPTDNIIKSLSLSLCMPPKRQQLNTYSVLTPFIDFYADVPVPTEILPGLYLSGVNCANDQILDKYNITNVLSVMSSPPELDKNKYDQMTILIHDSSNVNIRQYFESAHQFINSALLEKKKVLVHCHAGISRSATIVISYIMNMKTTTLTYAYKFVKDKREIVDPNFGFYCNLKKFEKELFDQKIEDEDFD